MQRQKKHIFKFKRTLPFLGISLIFFYWLSLFNHTSHIRESLTCYDSRGYAAVKEIMTKDALYDLLKNCSSLEFDKNSYTLLDGPNVALTRKGQQAKQLDPDSDDMKDEFNTNIAFYDHMYTVFSIKYNAPKFTAFFTRNVTADRNGLTFSARQKIELDKIESDFNTVVRVVAPAVAAFLILSRRIRYPQVISTVMSLLSVFLHTFFYGQFLPVFRLVLSFAWVIEFGFMVHLHIKGYMIVIPVLILTLAISLIFFAIMYDSSKWFRNVRTGYMVTISLMVGDHVMDMLTSLQGYSIDLYMRVAATCLLILILVLVVMSSVGSPFRRLIHISDTGSD